MASGTSYGVRKPKDHSPTPAPVGPRICPYREKLVEEIIRKLDAAESAKK